MTAFVIQGRIYTYTFNDVIHLKLASYSEDQETTVINLNTMIVSVQ